MKHTVLATDGYKFSRAEAGFPLRRETFYYSHRRGGPHYLPFDPKVLIEAMLPDMRSAGHPLDTRMPPDALYLNQHYAMGGAFWEAMRGEVEVKSLPKGSWFFDREPAFTITGPSALVSWLEPLVLQLHYRIQVATLAKLGRVADIPTVVTCDEQRDILLETLAAVGVAAPAITVDSDGYFHHVLDRVRELVDITGDPSRIFEVGMRAATCMAQHRLALTACKEAGLGATSNVLLARNLGMKPVGTMGHEHVQRFGSDEAAFRAMRDRFPGPTSFLLDTFDTIRSGLPTAFDLIAEEPSRRDSVRFDSGDKETQFLIACSMARTYGIKPRFILEDGFTADMTRSFEALRATQALPPEDVVYGFGGYIVKAPGDPLTRDRVAAVYKLTQSGPTPTMKFGDEPGSGKESIPGRLVLYRNYDEKNGKWYGFVGQEGEEIEVTRDSNLWNMYNPRTAEIRMVRFTPEEAVNHAQWQGARPRYSPATQALISTLSAARSASR